MTADDAAEDRAADETEGAEAPPPQDPGSDPESGPEPESGPYAEPDKTRELPVAGAPSPGEPAAWVGTTPGADVALLLAERDKLAGEVEALQGKVDRRAKIRSTLVGVLVILTCLSLTAATLAVWTKRNVLDTDTWVERVGPLADDPNVQAVLTDRVTAEIMRLVDPQALFEEVLPERGQLLAIPLSSAVESFVRDQVAGYFASSSFSELWVRANRVTHRTAVRVLEGESQVVRADSGSVTLDLVPIIDEVLKRISELSPEVFGQTIDIPEVSVEDLPEDSIATLASAFDIDLPKDFGQITVYDDGKLAEAQQMLNLFQKVEALLVIVTLLLFPLTIWLSRRRRRTILQLAVGSALGIVLIRRLALGATSMIVGEVKGGETSQAAVQAALDQFVDALLTGTAWLLALFALVAVTAAVTGPYRWAKALRHGAVHGGAAFGSMVASGVRGAEGIARDDATAVWLVEHKAAVQAGGVVVAVLLLWIFDLSWFGTLVLLGLLAAFEVAASRIGADDSADGPGAAPEGPGADVAAPA